MKNSQPGFIPILVIIALAAVAAGGGAYYYTHQPKETTVPVEEVKTTQVAMDTKTEVSATTKVAPKVPSEPKKVSTPTEKPAAKSITIKNDEASLTLSYVPPQTNPTPVVPQTTPAVGGMKQYTSAEYSLNFSYPASLKAFFGVNKKTYNSDGTSSESGGGSNINSTNSTQYLSVVVYERHPQETVWRIDEFTSNAQPEKKVVIGNVSGKLQYESFHTSTTGTQLRVRFVSDEINKNGKRYRFLAMVTLDQTNNWQSAEELLRSIVASVSFPN